MSRFAFVFVILALLGLVALRPVSAVCTGAFEESCFVLEVEVILTGGPGPVNSTASVSVTITFDITSSDKGIISGATICALAATSTCDWGNQQTTGTGGIVPAYGFGTQFPQPVTLATTPTSTVSTSTDSLGNLFVSALALNFVLTANQGGGNGHAYTGLLSITNPAGNTNGAAGTTTTLALTDNTTPSLSGSFAGHGPSQESCAAVVGDPQFVGLRGQSYQVHGIDGAVYNVISEQNTQVNARFTFLTEGECPIIAGVPATNCWSHPGSYLGEMSFQQRVDGKLHAALLTAGDAKKGYSMVQVDGKPLKLGERVEFGSFSVDYRSAYQVVINTDNFEFDLQNSDMFINQALRSKLALSKLQSHGLLGQTHAAKTYPNSLKFIEGEVDDYVIGDSDIFGDDFFYNRFQA
jgi:hypothetical protein